MSRCNHSNANSRSCHHTILWCTRKHLFPHSSFHMEHCSLDADRSLSLQQLLRYLLLASLGHQLHHQWVHCCRSFASVCEILHCQQPDPHQHHNRLYQQHLRRLQMLRSLALPYPQLLFLEVLQSQPIQYWMDSLRDMGHFHRGTCQPHGHKNHLAGTLHIPLEQSCMLLH